MYICILYLLCVCTILFVYVFICMPRFRALLGLGSHDLRLHGLPRGGGRGVEWGEWLRGGAANGFSKARLWSARVEL